MRSEEERRFPPEGGEETFTSVGGAVRVISHNIGNGLQPVVALPFMKENQRAAYEIACRENIRIMLNRMQQISMRLESLGFNLASLEIRTLHLLGESMDLLKEENANLFLWEWRRIAANLQE